MIDYCQFTMQSFMECYEIAGGLKSQIKTIKNITGDQSYTYLLYFLYTPSLSAKSYVNKNVKSQDALTISSNLAQSSALVEAKTFQIATENLVNMNSTSSH